MARKKRSLSSSLLPVLSLCIGLLCLSSLVACSGTKTITETRDFNMDAGEKTVISILLNKGDVLKFTVAVDENDIGIQVDGPAGQTSVEFTRVESGNFIVEADTSGAYVVNIDNSYSFFTSKSVHVTLEYPER